MHGSGPAHLQGFYKVEIVRGMRGQGNYHLHPKFSTLLMSPPSLFLGENVYSPEEIVQRIKDSMNTSLTVSSITTPTCTGKENQTLTQHERVKCVVDENKISMDPKLHTFTVMGSTRPHVVTLFPKETCSCPSTTQCYHIQAAKMSIGQHNPVERRQLNLSRFRKNACTRSEKKSGRKCPRSGDCDVIAAPDATTTQHKFESELGL